MTSDKHLFQVSILFVVNASSACFWTFLYIQLQSAYDQIRLSITTSCHYRRIVTHRHWWTENAGPINCRTWKRRTQM